MKVIIVEDEFLAQQELSWLIKEHSQMEIVGTFDDGLDVLKFLQHNRVDAIFLDINIPSLDGVLLAQNISQFAHKPFIVFITAWKEHAVEAFELEAFDYILKPYDEKRIQRTIKRYADSLELRENHRSPGEIINTSQRISLQTKDKTVMISPAQEIIIISTEKSDRSLFYTTSGIIESRMALRDAEQLLAPHGFFRTHKGYIVNLAMIQELESQDNGTLLLTMNYFPKEKVPVSRHYIKDFKNTLHIS